MRPCFSSFLLIVFSFSLQSQTGGLLIGGGTIVIMEGSPKIVIENGKYEFSGSFIQPGDSEIILAGDAPFAESLLGGTGFSQFNHLTINKSANGLRLQSSISVVGNVNFLNGMIDLNGFDLQLGTDSQLIGESENSRIIGANGGFVTININLNMPNEVNPGNLGVFISTGKNIGLTTIKRSHQPAQNGGNMGLQRVFDIEPTNNGDLNATLKFQYFAGELNGNSETDLTIYRRDDSNWEDMGVDVYDFANRTLEVFGIDHFSEWTIGSLSNALPVELLSFTAKANERATVDLNWVTASEIQNDHFIIEKSENGLDFFQLGKLNTQGNSHEEQTYCFEDVTPFSGVNYYRLKQVDYSNESSYSPIRLVNFFSSHHEIQIYPNPTTHQLTLEINLTQDSPVDVQLTDVLGRHLKTLIRENVLEKGSQKFGLSLPKLAKGIYFLKINIGGDYSIKRLVID